jgi:peroxiredoxin
MFKTILLIALTNVMFCAYGQDEITGRLTVGADLSNFKELPLKVVIEREGLGDYETTVDTVSVGAGMFKYETMLPEPEFLKITFFWPQKRLTSTTFWAVPSTYQLNINKDLVPTLLTSPTGLASRIIKLEKEVKTYRFLSDSLVKLVDFKGKKLAVVETRIDFIRDSIDNLIDNVYKKAALDYPSSPLGLYALCKYAERPYVNQRVKSKPAEIAVLLNKLDPVIQQLRSAKTLASKLALGEQMAIGKSIKDIALTDTAGKIYKVSDFKGKYLLIDFWASWCMPCRAESYSLIKAYDKYKTKGFQILSITRDNITPKGDWLKAIEKDKVNIWPQLSDFDDLAQKAYGIRFIPANYLIDPNGIIIARDLRGPELEERLSKILK